MTITSKFSVSAKYSKANSGDFVVLPYANEKRALFARAALPAGFPRVASPKEQGKGQVAALVNGVAVYCQRLDAKYRSTQRAAKAMVKSALDKAQELNMKRVVVCVDKKHAAICTAVQEGALLGGYHYDTYLSEKKKTLPVVLISEIGRSVLTEGKVVAEAVNFVRDSLNAPPAEMFPQSLATAYSRYGRSCGLKMEVWNEKKLKTERCGGILAVGQGSAHAPRLVIGRYRHPKATQHLALVGKGVTFDSGGYCLKPAKSMEEMKLDMGGAAMMFGAAAAIAKLKLPINVTTYLPMVHNAISKDAYNVSDIVTTRSKQTVEVLNTDAEGRIILADALTLATEAKPDFIVDAATLTGACVVALGEEIAGLYGSDRKLNAQMLKAADAVGEDMWEMPLHMAYNSQYDSYMADMKNIGDRWGGSIGAALFLRRFVADVEKWMHLDIAGPGCLVSGGEQFGKGARGFGVKSVIAFAQDLASK